MSESSQERNGQRGFMVVTCDTGQTFGEPAGEMHVVTINASCKNHMLMQPLGDDEPWKSRSIGAICRRTAVPQNCLIERLPISYPRNERGLSCKIVWREPKPGRSDSTPDHGDRLIRGAFRPGGSRRMCCHQSAWRLVDCLSGLPGCGEPHAQHNFCLNGRCAPCVRSASYSDGSSTGLPCGVR